MDSDWAMWMISCSSESKLEKYCKLSSKLSSFEHAGFFLLGKIYTWDVVKMDLGV